MMTSFDYNYQNAFRCSLCSADLCHARAILHKSLPKSILVLDDVVVQMPHCFFFLVFLLESVMRAENKALFAGLTSRQVF